MGRVTLTYREGSYFYAVITLPNGQTYYKGSYNSRSAARRVALKENSKHSFAGRNGYTYNTKGL
jgi:hypothetical protein